MAASKNEAEPTGARVEPHRSLARRVARWAVREALPRAQAWLAATTPVQVADRWLNAPLAGRYEGHPRWYLLSPRFHQWRWSNPWTTPNEQVSAHWRNMPATRRDIPLLLYKYSSSMAMSPIYAEMARHIQEHGMAPVLDIGCGDGLLLRYLHEESSFPLEALWGVDLDPKRVAAARRQLYIGAVNPSIREERSGGPTEAFDDAAAMAIIAHQLRCHDLSPGNPWPIEIRNAGIMVATMTGVAPTFNNEEFAAVAERIADLRPTYILNTDLYVNIKENYGGRRGLEPFFRPYGYRQIFGDWILERLGFRHLRFFVLQRPYWRAWYFSILKST
jgi:hypothetical protein